MPSLVPCVSIHPRVERDSCSAKEEVNAFLGALRQHPWRGTAAQPRNRSMPSLLPCVSACPQCGEGQLLSQGRSQCLPWCLASAPAPSVERDSCSAKEEVNAFLGALRQHPPQSGEGQLLSQGIGQCLPWCLAASTPEWRGTAAQPRNRSMPSLLPCVSACPQCGEGQLLSQGRSQCLPWCLASAPAPSVERDSCSAKEDQCLPLPCVPPQSDSLPRNRSIHPRVERDSCSAKE